MQECDFLQVKVRSCFLGLHSSNRNATEAEVQKIHRRGIALQITPVGMGNGVGINMDGEWGVKNSKKIETRGWNAERERK